MKTIKIKDSIWIIGDVHGQYDLLLKLINKIPKNANICFVGDLIDRGYKSKEVVNLVRENNYFIVKGNHEFLMIEAVLYNIVSPWVRNGGIETIESYMNISRDIYEKGFYHNDTFNKLLENKDILDDVYWMKTLPKIIKFEFKNKKPLYVSHSGIRLEKDDSLIENLNPEDIVLWNRLPQKEVDFAVNIHGHSIISKENIFINNSEINIDTGAFLDNKYLSSGKAILTAIEYPSMEVIHV